MAADDEKKLELLIDALDEAFDGDDAAVDTELDAAGLDPVLVRARMRSLADELSADEGAGNRKETGPRDERAKPLPLPWVKKIEGRWRCEPAVASKSRDERERVTLDFSRLGLGGSVEVGIFLQSESDGSRALHIEWRAGFHHPSGFLLSLYRVGEQEPFFSRNIGSGYRGAAVLTPEDLGVDPARVPLKFAFEPDTN